MRHAYPCDTEWLGAQTSKILLGTAKRRIPNNKTQFKQKPTLDEEASQE